MAERTWLFYAECVRTVGVPTVTEREADRRPPWLQEWFEHAEREEARTVLRHREQHGVAGSPFAAPDGPKASVASFGRLRTFGFAAALAVPQLAWLLFLAYVVREALSGIEWS